MVCFSWHTMTKAQICAAKGKPKLFNSPQTKLGEGQQQYCKTTHSCDQRHRANAQRKKRVATTLATKPGAGAKPIGTQLIRKLSSVSQKNKGLAVLSCERSQCWSQNPSIALHMSSRSTSQHVLASTLAIGNVHDGNHSHAR